MQAQSFNLICGLAHSNQRYQALVPQQIPAFAFRVSRLPISTFHKRPHWSASLEGQGDPPDIDRARIRNNALVCCHRGRNGGHLRNLMTRRRAADAQASVRGMQTVQHWCGARLFFCRAGVARQADRPVDANAPPGVKMLSSGFTKETDRTAGLPPPVVASVEGLVSLEAVRS